MPTVAEFVDRAREQYGCQLEICPFGPRTLRCLSRTDDQGQEHVVILLDDMGEVLTPTVLRSWCVQLGIPPEDFGFTLSEDNR